MELIGIELWMPMEWRNGTAPKGGNNSWIVDGQRNAQRKKSKEWKWVWFVERATGLRPTSFNKQHSFLFISFPFHKEMNVLVELMKGIRMYYNSIKRQWSKKQKHEFMIGFALRNWCCPSPFNSHFFSQLALPNGRAGERNERVDGQWGPKEMNERSEASGFICLVKSSSTSLFNQSKQTNQFHWFVDWWRREGSEVNCPPMKWNELVGYELRSSAANERRSINLWLISLRHSCLFFFL